jgi:adenine-specific DNA-methyltransferase
VAGVKFRRQHQFGPFILDFFAPAALVAIEVDGGQHYQAEEAQADERRTRFLASHGILTLRFSNIEVLNDTSAVLDLVFATVSHRLAAAAHPHPNPLPQGEGAEVSKPTSDGHYRPSPGGEGITAAPPR